MPARELNENTSHQKTPLNEKSSGSCETKTLYAKVRCTHEIINKSESLEAMMKIIR